MSTVLIIEDSLTDIEIVSRCLRRGGLNVMTANDGNDAMTKISSQKPDVIILDIVLPDKSGFELCRALKAEAETSKIPVVICSTKASEMDKFWGIKQGADAYLTKPVDQEQLLHTVMQLIKG